MPLTTQDLIDRAGILDAITAYSQGLDQRNWELFARAWAPGATFTAPGEGVDEAITPEQLREQLVRNNDGTRLSGQHLLNNTHFRIDGDTAHTVTEASWTTLQQSHEPGVLYEVRAGGIYVDDLVHTEAGWRISARTLALKNKTTRHVPYPAERIAAITDTLHTDWY